MCEQGDRASADENVDERDRVPLATCERADEWRESAQQAQASPIRVNSIASANTNKSARAEWTAIINGVSGALGYQCLVGRGDRHQ
jgi:hypothetical protein